MNGGPRYVFCTRTGRPLSQRNVSRELRGTMKRAKLDNGRLAFPILSETNEDGKPIKVARGVLPSFHSFRHSAASHSIANGDGVEETSWMLGHANSNVTRAVYLQEVRTIERSAKRRGRLEARIGATLSSLATSGSTRDESSSEAEILRLERGSAATG